MADPAESPFDAALVAGNTGSHHDAAGITVAKLPDLGILSLIARKGQITALSRRLVERHGLSLPEQPRYIAGPELAALGIGPGRWLLICETTDANELHQRIALDIEGLAAIADFSDALAVLRLSGPSVRAVLAKGLPIDLHPRCFGPGDAATSAAALIPLHLWQLDECPTYELAVPRSLAVSFAVWLTESAAEFGLRVEP